MNLIDEAETLMLHQFRYSPKLNGLIRALVSPFSKALDELEGLHHGQYIANASDYTLDVIGAIVGQPRYGMSDEDYQAWIKVAVYLNNSAGTPENVLTILRILFGKKPPVRMEEYAPNDVVFTFFEYPKFPTNTLFAIIRSAAPITTNCQFIRADPQPNNGSAALTLSVDKKLEAFRFDHTAFSESHFADFFQGEAI